MIDQLLVENLLQQIEILLSHSQPREEGLLLLLNNKDKLSRDTVDFLMRAAEKYRSYHKIWVTLRNALKEAIASSSQEPQINTSLQIIDEIRDLIQKTVFAEMAIHQFPAIVGEVIIEE